MTVNRTIIDEWVEENGPDGLVRLALAAQVSASLLSKVRLGKVPKRENRKKLCKVLKVDEARLFPSVSSDEDVAS